MRNRPSLIAIASLGVATMLLAGCKSSSPAAAPAPTKPTVAAGPTSAAPVPSAAASGVPSGAASGVASAPAGGGGDPGAGPVSSASIRIANFFAPDAKPGPGLDIYDVPLQGQAATPILTNVAYGTVSAYVHPHQLANAFNKPVEMTVLPTGENPVTQKGDASQIDGILDDNSGAQATIRLTADGDTRLGGPTSLLGILSSSLLMEKGDDGQGGKGPAAPAITDGSSELLVDTNSLSATIHPGIYLMIDKSCKAPLNGDPNEKGVPYAFAADGVAPVSDYAVFDTTPGAHQVSVVGWTSDVGPSCKQLTTLPTSKLQSTTSATVTANQQIMVFVYGTSADDLHIVLAPIQP